MNKREYLRSIGFNVGERGRLTPAMLTALEGFKEVATPIGIPVIVHKNFVEEQGDMVRQPRTLYGRTREGKIVSFTTCRSCDKHMAYCGCDGILAPKSVIFSREDGVIIG